MHEIRAQNQPGNGTLVPHCSGEAEETVKVFYS